MTSAVNIGLKQQIKQTDHVIIFKKTEYVEPLADNKLVQTRRDLGQQVHISWVNL